MFPELSIDGHPVTDMHPEDLESVRLEFDDDHDDAQYRCRACGEQATETTQGFTTDPEGLVCPEFEATSENGPEDAEGPHDVEPIELAWCKRAGINLDQSKDSVRFSQRNVHQKTRQSARKRHKQTLGNHPTQT